MRNEVIEAIKSDGIIDKREVSALKSIVKKMHLGEFHDDHWKTVVPFVSLIALISDNEISKKEEEWFLKQYEEEFVISNVEQVFWLLSILVKEPNVFKDNKEFVQRLWNGENPVYDMANMLFLTFAKHFLKLDDKRINALADYFKESREKDVVEEIDEIVSGKVVEEEILLIINLVLNERYDLDKINEYLNQAYIERVFKGIKIEDSKLKYLAICNSLFADDVSSASEYTTLWESFKSSRLNPDLLQSVIYDYSLCELKLYEMDDYHVYLRD